MDYYKSFIIFLILLKVVFISLAVTHFYYKRTNQENTKKNKNVVYWKSRIEFIFVVAMSLLMLYLFSPSRGPQITITGETKILLFLFSCILLLTAKWENFFHTSKWFNQLQNSFR
jgi:uncharacterized membrane protein